jgi:hypothetical protein
MPEPGSIEAPKRTGRRAKGDKIQAAARQGPSRPTSTASKTLTDCARMAAGVPPPNGCPNAIPAVVDSLTEAVSSSQQWPPWGSNQAAMGHPEEGADNESYSRSGMAGLGALAARHQKVTAFGPLAARD